MKIAISVGHTLTGADTGAAAILNESNCTREVAAYAKKYLETAGHEVVLCRIDQASSVNDSLAYRVNLANNSNVDVFAEIHLNCGNGVGTEVYCIMTGGRAEKYATQVLSKIVALGYRNRGIKTANFYVLRNTNAPAILIECCFVDSQEDANRYNAEALGKAIAEGLINSSINTPTPQQTQPTASQCPSIRYQGQVENIGWQGWVQDGQVAGTEGKGLRLEALAIDYKGTGNISVEGHVQNVGWQSIRHDGEIIGTVGEALRLEAVKISLDDKTYSVQYQVHIQDIGWMDWVYDGAIAGTTGQGKRLEAIKIKVVKRG